MDCRADMTKSIDKQKVPHAKRQSLRVGEVLVSEGVVTEKEIQNAPASQEPANQTTSHQVIHATY